RGLPAIGSDEPGADSFKAATSGGRPLGSRRRSDTHVGIVALDWIVLFDVPYEMFTPLTVPPARTLALIRPPRPLTPPRVLKFERLSRTPRSTAVGALWPPCPSK